jgi:hypothetical protein
MLNLSVSIATEFARESHNDDLFEERNARETHLSIALSSTSIAICGKLQDLLPDITIFKLHLLINWL